MRIRSLLMMTLGLAVLVAVAMPASAAHHLCGDGVINDGELCDPNRVPTGCPEGESCYPYDAESGLAACTCGGFEFCGNGIVDGSEDCDPAIPDPADCCDDSCAFELPGAACGPSEACDGAGTCEPVADTDTDGVDDSIDNCTLAQNPGQQDTDTDGHGNACDPDLNNDCSVNFGDLAALKAVVFTIDPGADFNSDGFVNFIDLGIMKSLFFNSPSPGPGPSAAGLCTP